MNNNENSLYHNKRKRILVLGILLISGGVILAYLTQDAEPWGTIGGFLAGIGFVIALIFGFPKKYS